MFEGCVVLFCVAYATGGAFYRLLGMWDENAELKRWSGWHIAFLETIAGVWLIFSSINRGGQAMRSPIALGVGVFMLALAAWEVRQARRNSPTRPNSDNDMETND